MIYNWISGNPKNITSSSAIWNTIGGAVNAGQSAIILIFISRRLGLEIAGMVTIAFAIAQIFLSISKYGVRNYQVTDVTEKTTFKEYLSVRLITLAITIAVMVIYLLYSLQTGTATIKLLIILEIIVLKLIDGFEDVFVGRFQQLGRLDIGAKIMAIRLIISTLAICISVLVGAGICLSLFIGIVSSIILDLYFLIITLPMASIEQTNPDRRKILQLLKVCLPLCIGTTLSIYIGNVPKYMINDYMDETTQAIFGYIMLPVFIVTLLNQFIYQPMIKSLGDLWAQKNIKGFQNRILRQCLIVGGLVILVLVGGLIVGLPILSLLYGTDLTGYQMEFTVLLIGGGFYAIAYYLNIPLTTIRMQNSLAIGYAVASLVALLSGKWFVTMNGMMGAAFLYLLINILLVIIYFFVLLYGIKKKSSKQEEL